MAAAEYQTRVNELETEIDRLERVRIALYSDIIDLMGKIVDDVAAGRLAQNSSAGSSARRRIHSF
jgi:hypothetical protein